MNFKIITIASLLAISVCGKSQTELQMNITDQHGMKQGHWIKKYLNESVMYDGNFKDNHPVGEFRRYLEDKSLISVLIYSSDGRTAIATIYHPNGRISSKGTYVDQLREGKWQFFSAFTDGYLISEETYTKNLRNGLSVKFYPDSSIAEKIAYINDIKQGEWVQYYPSGIVALKSNYLNGKIDGKFEMWYDTGTIQISGQYKNDSKEGLWIIYKNDGTTRYKLEYMQGITNNRQMENDGSDLLDSLERNKGKFTDPEKTGVIR
jgi:antitoxin component YwqK of YwqJK toxin-antitoxin module